MYCKEEMHIGKLIREKLNENGRSASWLASKVHCDRSTINKQLRKDYIDTDLLLRISEILDFDFFSCYSDFIKSTKMMTNFRKIDDNIALC